MALPIQYSELNLSLAAKSILNKTLNTHRGQSLQVFGKKIEAFSEMGCLIFYDANPSSDQYLDKENLTFIAIVQSDERGFYELDKGATDYLLESQLTENIILKSIIQAEKGLESRAEAKYRTLVESTSDGIWHHDLLTDNVVWSQSLYQILGYQKQDGIKPSRIPKLAHPEDRERVEESLKQLVYKGMPYSTEFRIKKSDGKYIWVKAEGNGLRNGNGEVILILGAVRNIEKRKRAEIDLATSKNQIENIAKGVRGALARHRAYPDGKVDILYVSPGIEDLWDLNPEQVKSNPEDMILQLSQQERERLIKAFVQCAKQNKEVDHTYERIGKNGNRKYLRVTAIPHRLNHGVVEWDSITTDVTEIKKIEEQSEEQKLLLEKIISNVDGVVQRYKIDTNGDEKLIFISKGYEKVSGIPISEVKKNHNLMWDQIIADDRKRVLESFYQCYHSLSPWQETWRIKSRSGEIKWIQASGSPTKQVDGSVIFDTVTTEITRLKDITSKLASSKQEFRLAARAAHLGLWKYDPINNTLEWDDQMHKIFGTDSSKATGTIDDWKNSLHPKDREKSIQILETTLSTGADLEYQFRITRKDNSEVRHIRASANAIKDVDGKVCMIVGLNWDVTHIVKAQEKLAESNKRYALAAKATQDVIWELNMYTGEMNWNESLMDVFGYPANTGLADLDVWEKLVHPEDRESASKSLAEFIQNGTGNKWEEKYRMKKGNGEYAHVIDRGYVIRDLNGKALKMVGSLRDVTARTEFLNAIQAQNEKLRRIAWTQSHELRGPLTRIMGLIDVLEKDRSGLSIKEFLEHLKSSTGEMDDVIRKIVDASEEVGINIPEGD